MSPRNRRPPRVRTVPSRRVGGSRPKAAAEAVPVDDPTEPVDDDPVMRHVISIMLKINRLRHVCEALEAIDEASPGWMAKDDGVYVLVPEHLLEALRLSAYGPEDDA